MKKKLKILAVLWVLLSVTSFFINYLISIALVVIGLVAFSCLIAFFLCNKMIKQTNWWKNKFVYTKKFCSNAGYRKYLVRNLDIVNVGSNPALFGFFYGDILGENWSSGTQGLNMDFEILKYRYSFLKEGGTVLIPLVLFSSVSEYLNSKPNYRSVDYYVKYLNILDSLQMKLLPCFKDVFKYNKWPLLYNKKAIKFLIRDVEPNQMLNITTQTMSLAEMQSHADSLIDAWKKEFDIRSLSDSLNESLKMAMEETSIIAKNMITFLQERNLRPVFVFPPMSETLCQKIPVQAIRHYVYDFITMVNKPEVPFLDYSNDAELKKNENFFNSLFMNQIGRKTFSKRVFEDIGLRSR